MLTTTVPKGIKSEVFVRVDSVVVIKLQELKDNHTIIVVILYFCRYPPLGGLTTTCVDKLVAIPGGGGHFHIEGVGDVPLARV